MHHQRTALEEYLVLKVDNIPGLSEHAPWLVESDGTLSAYGWATLSAVVSSLFCLLCYKISRFLTPPFTKAYKHLSLADQRNWDSRYSSNVHAVLCVVFAHQMLWKSDFFWKDDAVPMIIRTCPASYAALGMSFGYFAIDFVICVKYSMGGMEMLLHHAGSLMAVTTALFTGQAHMHTIWMLVTEFTTPLINNRWWLDKMEMKTHILYVINGLSILLCWIFARLAVFPPFFMVLWSTRDQMKHCSYFSGVLMVAVPVILTVLNCYWFVKIVKGAWKVLFGAPKSKQA